MRNVRQRQEEHKADTDCWGGRYRCAKIIDTYARYPVTNMVFAVLISNDPKQIIGSGGSTGKIRRPWYRSKPSNAGRIRNKSAVGRHTTWEPLATGPLVATARWDVGSVDRWSQFLNLHKWNWISSNPRSPYDWGNLRVPAGTVIIKGHPSLKRVAK